jgi:hypothetical protein
MNNKNFCMLSSFPIAFTRRKQQGHRSKRVPLPGQAWTAYFFGVAGLAK